MAGTADTIGCSIDCGVVAIVQGSVCAVLEKSGKGRGPVRRLSSSFLF